MVQRTKSPRQMTCMWPDTQQTKPPPSVELDYTAMQIGSAVGDQMVLHACPKCTLPCLIRDDGRFGNKRFVHAETVEADARKPKVKRSCVMTVNEWNGAIAKGRVRVNGKGQVLEVRP